MLKTICVEVIAGLIEHLGKSIFQFNNILIDSRKIEPGDAFIGIKGRNTDGNLYATEALKRGASFVVVDNDEIYRGLNGNKILVRDSFRALKSIGAFYLENYDGLTVAITGSAGKTSTKELLYTVLSRKFQVYRNYKNYNNALGLALCSANLDMGSDIAIFDCGTNGKGEILELSNYLLPDITIITNIGYSHIGHFGSLEEIAKEKLSIIEPLTVQELWINNSDYKKYNHLIDKLVHVKTFAYKKDLNANIYIDKLEYVNNKIHFNVCYKNRTRQYILNHFFTHLAYDALPAIALAIDMGIPEKLICESLAQYIPLSGRGCMINIDNITIVDDTYNASYDAIIASLNILSIRNEEKIVILG
jgi:UDP-N-acetylmuramoyl-tripeptide--D-alanyl-D-alanine ligase